MTHTGNRVAAALSKIRFRTNREADLQRGIAEALDAAGIVYKREYRLDERSIVDFYIPDWNVGIEAKNDKRQTLPGVTRQLFRYSESDEIDSLVLVTSKRKLTDLPDEMNGVPIFIVSLWKTFL